jgi:predicted metal-dependent peptidase
MAITTPKLRTALRDMTMIHPFWATIVLHFDIKADDKTETFSIDGKTIRYNPKLSESWSTALNMFALAHEAGHVMLHHLQRPFDPQPGSTARYGFVKGKTAYWDRALYYRAGDYLINDMLKKSGFTLWNKCLWDAKYDSATWTTEKVYRDLIANNKPKPPQPKDPNDAGGKGDPQQGDSPSEPSDEGDSPAEGSGEQAEDKPAGSHERGIDNTDPMGDDHVGTPADDFNEQEVREMVSRAASIAKAQGKLPSSIEGMLKEATEPQYPVFRLLEQFVNVTMQSDDSSWRKPHQHFFGRGIILPGDYSDKIDHVVVVYDTSGSVPDADLSRFHRVAGDIFRRLNPQKLTLYQVDSDIHSITDVKKHWPNEIKVTGRGGTSFKPPFADLRTKRITPTCLVYLTDLCGDFPDYRPNYPVLWVSTEKGSKAPFGTTIVLNQ